MTSTIEFPLENLSLIMIRNIDEFELFTSVNNDVTAVIFYSAFQLIILCRSFNKSRIAIAESPIRVSSSLNSWREIILTNDSFLDFARPILTKLGIDNSVKDYQKKYFCENKLLHF